MLEYEIKHNLNILDRYHHHEITFRIRIEFGLSIRFINQNFYNSLNSWNEDLQIEVVFIFFEIVFHSHFKCFTKGGSQFFSSSQLNGVSSIRKNTFPKQKTTNENALLPSSIIIYKLIFWKKQLWLKWKDDQNIYEKSNPFRISEQDKMKQFSNKET